MAIFRRPDFPRARGASDAVPLLPCSVHEEGGCGLDVPSPGWEVRRVPLCPCTVRRV